MRTILTRFLIMIFLGLGTLVSAQETKPTPEAKTTETLEQRIERLKALEKQVLESPEEVKLRQAAAELKQKNDLKEVKKAIASTDSPELKELRKKAEEDAKKEEERLRVNAKARVDAKILGCNPSSSVQVHSYAEQYKSSAAQFALRIFNDTDGTVDSIETAYKKIGLAVGNLCSGGSLQIGFILESTDYQHRNVSFVLTARGRYADGRKFVRDYQVTLQNYQTFNTYNDYDLQSVWVPWHIQ